MSFYRTILAAVAAIAIASPVFADDTANAAQNPSGAAPAAQSSDNSAAQAPASAASQGAAMSDTKISINKATAKELMKVKGMKAAQARAIIAYRKKHGDFKSLDELANVKGFKKMNQDKMMKIEDQLSVE